MGIGSVGAIGGSAGRQETADPVSRNLKTKISDVEREKQGLTSKQEISAEEKTRKRQELQQDLSSLNTKLKQRQEESRRETIRKERQDQVVQGDGRTAGIAESERSGTQADVTRGGRTSKNRTDAAQTGTAGSMKASRNQAGGAPADTIGSGRVSQNQGNTARTDAAESIKTSRDQSDVAAAEKDKQEKQTKRQEADKEALRSVIAGEDTKEQTRRREAVIARMESGIVILKGEIKQDEMRGADVEKKKAELKKQEQKLQRASSALPDVKASLKTANTARKRTDGTGKSSGGQQQSGTFGNPVRGTVKSSRDGVVIITPNVFGDSNG